MLNLIDAKVLTIFHPEAQMAVIQSQYQRQTSKIKEMPIFPWNGSLGRRMQNQKIDQVRGRKIRIDYNSSRKGDKKQPNCNNNQGSWNETRT